jgi:hypothetical protein
MLPITFFELFEQHLHDSTLEHPPLFGLEAFSADELAAKGYELIGDPTDFHFYEKSHATAYHRQAQEVILKCYFFNQQRLGSGFSIVRGVRLASLLRHCKRLEQQGKGTRPNLAWYFSDDKKEGAVILNDRHVMRFNQWSHKGAYQVATLESDFDSSNPLGQAATRSVKHTFEHHSLASMRKEARNARQPGAFRRLLGALHDAI